jgi:large subunit ribosomal protein L15
MQAHQLKPPKGSTHVKRRVGRGNASGTGTYSGKGLKGQKARSGIKPRRFFEGGQTELMRRLPTKRGFTNPFRIEYTPVNLRDLDRFPDGAEVTPESLKEAGILNTTRRPVKLLGDDELDRKLNVRVHKFSMNAREKIEAAGGTATELTGDDDSK